MRFTWNWFVSRNCSHEKVVYGIPWYGYMLVPKTLLVRMLTTIRSNCTSFSLMAPLISLVLPLHVVRMVTIRLNGNLTGSEGNSTIRPNRILSRFVLHITYHW